MSKESCRDCKICSLPGLQSILRSWGAFCIHLCSAGISILYIKWFRKNCPKCGHSMSDHLKRADGSFQD